MSQLLEQTIQVLRTDLSITQKDLEETKRLIEGGFSKLAETLMGILAAQRLRDQAAEERLRAVEQRVAGTGTTVPSEVLVTSLQDNTQEKY